MTLQNIHQCRGLTLLWLSSRHKIANSRFSLGSRLTGGCWSIVTMLARILTKYWSMNHAQCQLRSRDQRLLKTRDYANLGSGEWEYPLERERIRRIKSLDTPHCHFINQDIRIIRGWGDISIFAETFQTHYEMHHRGNVLCCVWAMSTSAVYCAPELLSLHKTHNCPSSLSLRGGCALYAPSQSSKCAC